MFASLAAAALLATAAPADAAPPVVQAAAPAMHSYGGVALDPAGRRIALLETTAASGHHGVVSLRDTRGAVTGQIDPCAACAYGAPTWSPDGKSLAFIGREGAKASLFVADVAAPQSARVLTVVNGLADSPRWSPDGKTLAMLVTPDAVKETGATQPGARLIGEIGALPTDSQRIAVVPVAGGDLRLVSADGIFIYEYDWTPDSTGFVATAARGNGDNNWWVAKLEAFDLAGAERVILSPPYQMNNPKVSPDGQTIAFIGGVMSDFGSVGGDVYTVPLAGGEATNVTPGFAGSITSIDWRGTGIVAGIVVGGGMGTARIDPVAKRIDHVSTTDVSLRAGDGAVSLNASGDRAVFVSEAFDRPARLEFGPLGGARAITHDNDGVTPNVKAQSLTWSSDEFQVQGWLLSPPTLAPGQTYPMIVEVHGGPSAATVPRFVSSGTVKNLIDAGYMVFLPNPRGSYGQGAAFAKANYQDFGGGDLRDILAGVDAVEKVAPVDDKRLGIYGHSYGGFMTMWTVTHSQRFAAAVAGAGIANWSSYYGQNGIDQWMTPFFGAPFYDDPAVYDRLSPIRTIKDARTPTFIYVGERDLETPAAQSLEFWHGLNALGQAPTSLVIYEGEGHGIRQPEHAADLEHRIVGWFDQYLKPAATPAQ